MLSIELTKEEAEFLLEGLNVIPLQGNAIAILPILKMISLLHEKIRKALSSSDPSSALETAEGE